MGRLKDMVLDMVEAELEAKPVHLCALCRSYHTVTDACAAHPLEIAHASASATDGVVVKDSGQRREVDTGSRRDVRDGKGRYDLLQWRALGLVARQLEEGAKKYGERNWELGQPLSWYADSCTRHLGKHIAGYRDERHDVAAAWNILCFLDTVVRIEEGLLPRELDDIGHFTFKAVAA